MKQKYRIWKKAKDKELLIQEYAVLTAQSRKQKLPGMLDEDFSLLCEQTYQADEVKKATSQGNDEVIRLLRSRHFFPIGTYMKFIADTVTSMYTSKGDQHEDLIFDDKEILLGTLPEAEDETITDIDEDEIEDDQADDIDDLLEDDSPASKKGVAAKIKPDQLDED